MHNTHALNFIRNAFKTGGKISHCWIILKWAPCLHKTDIVLWVVNYPSLDICQIGWYMFNGMIYMQKDGDMIYCTCKTAHWHTLAKLTSSRPGFVYLCSNACICRFPSAAGFPQCVKQSGHHQSLPPPHGHCQAPRERCKSQARQRTRLPASREKQLTYYASERLAC